MIRSRMVATVLAAALGAAPAVAPLARPASAQEAAQQTAVQSQLQARGMPGDLAASVAQIVQEARFRGLPASFMLNKAIEGWAKRVPPPRILAAVRDLGERLAAARAALAAAGPRGAEENVIGAGAEAMARGITRDDVVAIVESAPAAEAASAGLAVAASLAAQGLDRALSVQLVIQAFRQGRTAAQVLDLPSAARSMLARGTPAADVGRQLLEGMGRGGAGAQGRGAGTVRPTVVPPGLGGVPPGSTKRP